MSNQPENSNQQQLGENENNQQSQEDGADHQVSAPEVPSKSSEINTDAVVAKDDSKSTDTGSGTTSSADVSNTSSDIYHVKWIRRGDRQHPVVTQNVNGPCPLLAIANTLLLRGTIELPSGCAYVTSHDLMQRLGNALMSAVARQNQRQQLNEPSNSSSSDPVQSNLEQLVGDSLSLFPKLQTGLDINVRFSGYSKFEYTPELDIFDRFDIDLVHGWVLDPQQSDVSDFIGSLTYNQLVEKIITAKSDCNYDLAPQAIAAEEFLASTCNQLTVCGLMQLAESLNEGALCVLFRNNHFSTLTKQKGKLYLLVTDQGFLHQPDVVWETLDNIDNDSSFVGADFHPSEIEATAGYPDQSPTDAAAGQVERDRQLAIALQNQTSGGGGGGGGASGVHPSTQTDEELALQLQREEEQLFQRQQEQQQQQQQQQRQRQQQYPQPSGQQNQRQEVSQQQQQQQQAFRNHLPQNNNQRSNCTCL